MTHVIELLPFVFLGIVFGVFISAGNISTRSGVRPPLLPYNGDSLGSPPFVTGFMANFVDLISRLVTAFRGAIVGARDPCTTSLSHLSFDVELHVDPSDLLWSNAEPMGWAGLRRLAFDVLSSFEGSPDAYPLAFMQPICNQKYVISVLLTLLSYPNAITPCARADITDRLMRDETTVFNDEYLVTFTSSNNYSVADFIIATSNEVSPIVIGMIHLAGCDHGVARAFHQFSRHQTSWERFHRNLPGIPSIQEIAHFVHCQTPVWPPRVSSTLSDGEIEFIAALLATATFSFHDGSIAIMK